MQNTDTPHPLETSTDPRELGHWARAYAQNRSLGMVVMMVISVILCFAMGVPSYYGGMAYRDENWPLFWVCIAGMVIAAASVIYFSMPWWGGKLVERITKRLYAEEGRVQIGQPCTLRHRRIGIVMGVAFGACITAEVNLGVLGCFPQHYMQPISAIYMVPFLAGLWLLMRPAVGPIALLWPTLYALHAILIVIGAPILFVGQWDSLNMFLPVFGYGLLTGLVAHFYSRFALARLRRTTRGNFQDEPTEEPQP